MQIVRSGGSFEPNPFLELGGLALVNASLPEILLVVLADGAGDVRFLKETRPRPAFLLSYLVADGEQHLPVTQRRCGPIERAKFRRHSVQGVGVEYPRST